MTSRTAALRYARALFDVALKQADPERVGTELSAFATTATEHETLWRVLTSPAVPVARKRAAVQALVERVGPMTPALGKLLLLMADRDRLALLPEVAAGYRERVLDHKQVVRAEVTTAVPLPAERRAAIECGLAEVTGRTVLLDTRVDPSLLGGAVTRIGSTVYDGSIVRQLERLQERLTEPA